MTVKAPKVQTVEAKREEVREKWSLHKSVFSARKKEAASKDFYDTYAIITVVCAHAKTPRAAVLLCRERVNRKAFEIDWGRVVAKERFCRVVLKAANDDSDELEQVMLVVKKYYGLLSDAFEYYGASPVEPYSSTSNSLWPHAVQPLEAQGRPLPCRCWRTWNSWRTAVLRTIGRSIAAVRTLKSFSLSQTLKKTRKAPRARPTLTVPSADLSCLRPLSVSQSPSISRYPCW